MDLNTLITAAQDSAYGLLIAIVLAAVWAFYTGRVHSDREFSKLEKENEELRAALADERQRSDEAVRAGTVTNQLISALAQVATERAAPARGKRAGLTAGDVGL